MSQPFTGRRVLVTGASRGLGAALLDHFTRAGAETLGIARTIMPGRLVHGDITDPDCASAFCLARPDILFCNAGVYGPVGPLETNDLSAWHHCLSVNLIGAVNCVHAAIPHMRRNGGGKIILVAGGGAAHPRPNFSAYATSKAALVRLMECLAPELKPHRIDINAMAPGFINTGIHQAVVAAGIEASGQEEFARAAMASSFPPDFTKALSLAEWLASPASDGITGRLISVHHDYRSLSP